ncbi:hypothetical protein ACFWC6_34040, partial [Micromonospora chalcea]
MARRLTRVETEVLVVRPGVVQRAFLVARFRGGSPERLWLQLCDGTQVRTPVRRRRAGVNRLRDGGTVPASERYEGLLAD